MYKKCRKRDYVLWIQDNLHGYIVVAHVFRSCPVREKQCIYAFAWVDDTERRGYWRGVGNDSTTIDSDEL